MATRKPKPAPTTQAQPAIESATPPAQEVTEPQQEPPKNDNEQQNSNQQTNQTIALPSSLTTSTFIDTPTTIHQSDSTISTPDSTPDNTNALIITVTTSVILAIFSMALWFYFRRKKAQQKHDWSQPHESNNVSTVDSTKQGILNVGVGDKRNTVQVPKVPTPRQESKMDALPDRKPVDPELAAEYEKAFNASTAVVCEISDTSSYSSSSGEENVLVDSVASSDSITSIPPPSVEPLQNFMTADEYDADNIYSSYDHALTLDRTALEVSTPPDIIVIPNTPSPPPSIATSTMDRRYKLNYDQVVYKDVAFWNPTVHEQDSIHMAHEAVISDNPAPRTHGRVIADSLSKGAPEFSVIEDFDATLSKHLSLKRGDTVSVIQAYQNGTAFGYNRKDLVINE